jgi:hypothetical protein
MQHYTTPVVLITADEREARDLAEWQAARLAERGSVPGPGDALVAAVRAGTVVPFRKSAPPPPPPPSPQRPAPAQPLRPVAAALEELRKIVTTRRGLVDDLANDLAKMHGALEDIDQRLTALEALSNPRRH